MTPRANKAGQLMSLADLLGGHITVKVTLALLLALSMALQTMLLGLPLFIMHVFDGVMEMHNLDTLIFLCLIYLVAILLVVTLQFIRSVVMHRVAERFERRLFLRNSLGAVALGQRGASPFAAFLLRDYGDLRRFASGNALTDWLDLLCVPLVLVVLYLLHPLYCLLTAASCVLLGLLGLLSDRVSRRQLEQASQAHLRASHDLGARLSRRDEVEGLGLLPAVLRRWRVQYTQALSAMEEAERRAKALNGVSAFVHTVATMAMFVAGAWLVVKQYASPGSIMAASLLSSQAFSPFGKLVQNWYAWSMARLSYHRSRDLVRQALPSGRPAALAQGAGAGLALRDVTLAVPRRPAPLVAGLTLAVPPGGVLLVTGPNGSGKSTLLRCLAGLALPAEGAVFLDSQDVHAASRDEIGPMIGFLGQRPQLLEGSVAENIARFTGRSADAVAAARLAGVHDTIGRWAQGYATQAGGASGLSGGQRRMVALARALFGPPRLVALDEPEAALDEPAIQALRQAVKDLSTAGAIVVLVTHDPAGWQGIADHELRLSGTGRWTLDTHPEAANAASMSEVPA